MRSVLVALVAVGLAIGVFVLWPNADDEDPPTTEAIPTTTTTAGTPTTQPPPTTTTASESGSHVVETVEEAEEILRELWFGWFEGIYNQDEDRIREVVGNPRLVDDAVAQFGVMEFIATPDPNVLFLRDTEILKSDEECFAVWADVDASPVIGASNDGVHVFVWQNGWFFVSQWANRADLWDNDCASQLHS